MRMARLLRERGYRITPQRQLVLEAVVAPRSRHARARSSTEVQRTAERREPLDGLPQRSRCSRRSGWSPTPTSATARPTYHPVDDARAPPPPGLPRVRHRSPRPTSRSPTTFVGSCGRGTGSTPTCSHFAIYGTCCRVQHGADVHGRCTDVRVGPDRRPGVDLLPPLPEPAADCPAPARSGGLARRGRAVALRRPATASSGCWCPAATASVDLSHRAVVRSAARTG